jgi:ERCC4-type nuclease
MIRRRSGEEWVLPYIVERKTAEDLRASIQVGALALQRY